MFDGPDPLETETIEEAIVILRSSRTVKDHPLGYAMMAKVTAFQTRGQIIFDPGMDPKKRGESFENFAWRRIRLNIAWITHPVTVAAVIGHEAVHLASDTEDQVEEEVECREFDVAFLAELEAGTITYSYQRQSQASLMATAPLRTAIMKLPFTTDGTDSDSASPIMTDYYDLKAAARTKQLIDMVLGIRLYADLLKANWLVDHLQDWGGLGNRKPATLGLFVKCLVCADQRPAYFAPYILEVLQAIPAGSWSQAKQAMGDFGRIQSMGTYIEKLPDPSYKARLDALDASFGDKLRLF